MITLDAFLTMVNPDHQVLLQWFFEKTMNEEGTSLGMIEESTSISQERCEV